MRQVALHVQVAQLEGLLGTDDLNDWETGFVESLVKRGYASDSQGMSAKQADHLEKLYRKHFA